jgi:hypothetical protein
MLLLLLLLLLLHYCYCFTTTTAAATAFAITTIATTTTTTIDAVTATALLLLLLLYCCCHYSPIWRPEIPVIWQRTLWAVPGLLVYRILDDCRYGTERQSIFVTSDKRNVSSGYHRPEKLLNNVRELAPWIKCNASYGTKEHPLRVMLHRKKMFIVRTVRNT